MKRKLMRGAAALALGVLGGVLAEGGRPAAAATLIQSCPFTAMQPGTYVLARDLTCPSPAINVTANNVNLVLAGHTLTTGFIGIVAQNVTGLRITGGTIASSFGVFGILLLSTPNARVIGVTVTGSNTTNVGITVGNNTANNTTGVLLAGNTVMNFKSEGISFTGTTDALLAGNTVTNNGSGGINLSGGSNSNRVVGNTITSNRNPGINVDPGSTGNQFLGNTATGNTPGPDLVDSNLPTCVNTWRGNTFVTDNEGGAAFGPGAGCIR